jgi:hypothetical protein
MHNVSSSSYSGRESSLIQHGTVAIADRKILKSSTDFSALRTVVQWRSRFSQATRRILNAFPPWHEMSPRDSRSERSCSLATGE